MKALVCCRLRETSDLVLTNLGPGVEGTVSDCVKTWPQCALRLAKLGPGAGLDSTQAIILGAALGLMQTETWCKLRLGAVLDVEQARTWRKLGLSADSNSVQASTRCRFWLDADSDSVQNQRRFGYVASSDSVLTRTWCSFRLGLGAVLVRTRHTDSDSSQARTWCEFGALSDLATALT